MKLSDVALPDNAVRAKKLQSVASAASRIDQIKHTETADKVLLFGLLGLVAELEAELAKE